MGHWTRKEKKDDSSTWLYLYAAISFFLGELLATVALKWVTYPVLIVAKSAKPIPTIVLTVIIGRSRYHWRKYLFTTLIVIGVALFLFTDNSTAKLSKKIWWGEGLLIASLLIDGICNGLQERIKNDYAPTAFSMMLKMNGMSFLMIGAASALSGEATNFFYFAQRHPQVIPKILGFGLVGACGQIFIFYMISLFGTLSCSLVTTIRKCLTIGISVMINSNPLLTHQWIGAVLVFGSVIADVLYSSGDRNVPDDDELNNFDKELSYRPNEAFDAAIRSNSIYIVNYDEKSFNNIPPRVQETRE